MGKVYVFDHPLIQHKVALMRMKETNVKDFRDLAREIAMLMGFEATRDLELEEVEIETPICKTRVNMLKGEDIAIIPILRAGLGFVDGMLELVPNAKVGHVGLYRDPDTHEPVDFRSGPYAGNGRQRGCGHRFHKEERRKGYSVHVPYCGSGRNQSPSGRPSGR